MPWAISGLLVAKQKRKEAGQIFLKARKSSIPEEKKVLLVSSYEILKNINERYPTNQYADKVRANMDIVLKELKKVAPEYVE